MDLLVIEKDKPRSDRFVHGRDDREDCQFSSGEVVDGVTIPSGFELLRLPASEIIQLPHSEVRWLYQNSMPFRFDPTDQGFQGFRDLCREQTKALTRVLCKLSKHESDAKIWTSRRAKPAMKQDWHTVNFVILPPHFFSIEQKTDSTRLQARNNQSLIALHVDPKGTVVSIRGWTSSSKSINRFNKGLMQALDLQKRCVLSRLYKEDNWELLAAQIWIAIKNNRHHLTQPG